MSDNMLEELFKFPFLHTILGQKAIQQTEELIRNSVVSSMKNEILNIEDISFGPHISIDNFQKNLYNLDEILLNQAINTTKQLDNIVVLLEKMLSYIEKNLTNILSLEPTKVKNIKNNFRGIQDTIKYKIKLKTPSLSKLIENYDRVYSIVIPNLPEIVNPSKQVDYLSNLSLDNFNSTDKEIFQKNINDLKSICYQIIQDTEYYKKLKGGELLELQDKLSKLITIIESILPKNEDKTDINYTFACSSLRGVKITITRTINKIAHRIRIKNAQREIKTHIKTYPSIETESIMRDFSPYIRFIKHIDQINNFLLLNKDVIRKLDKNDLEELKKILDDVNVKLDYIISKSKQSDVDSDAEQPNINNVKFILPANRLSKIVPGLLSSLEGIMITT